MTTQDISNQQALAVCLHASAGSSRQWLKLAVQLEPHIRTLTPDLIGYGNGAAYDSGKRFGFAQEVDSVLTQIDRETGNRNGPLHLVGHSYGAATALQLALNYPQRVASLTLYEPAQFLLLFADGLKSDAGQEILALRQFVRNNGRSSIRRRSAARGFIEYWSGEGAWDRIPCKRQRRIARLMPKVAAEFEAILSANVSAADFADLNIPARLVYGSNTRTTARKVTEVLAGVLPDVECIAIDGAGHMAPMSHAEQINPLIAEHVIACLQAELAVAA